MSRQKPFWVEARLSSLVNKRFVLHSALGRIFHTAQCIVYVELDDTLFILYYVHSSLSIVHLYITYCTQYMCTECTLYTIFSTLFPVNFCTLRSANSLNNVHYTVYLVHCKLYIIFPPLFPVHCLTVALYSTPSKLQCTLCNVQCTMYTAHHIFHPVLCALPTVSVHCTLHTL